MANLVSGPASGSPPTSGKDRVHVPSGARSQKRTTPSELAGASRRPPGRKAPPDTRRLLAGRGHGTAVRAEGDAVDAPPRFAVEPQHLGVRLHLPDAYGPRAVHRGQAPAVGAERQRLEAALVAPALGQYAAGGHVEDLKRA